MAKNGKAEPKVSKVRRKITAVQLSIKRINPDNVRSVPINDIIVNHSENEFFITFSSVEPPAILDPKELEKLSDINAITRAKIVVSPDFLEAIIKALTINLEKYKTNIGK
jgi:hypothetical protein